MKLIKFNPKQLSPKRLFRSKKDRSVVSRSDPSSFGSGASSSSSSSSGSDTHTTHEKSSSGDGGVAVDTGTPKSVLPETSGVWPAFSNDIRLEHAFKLIDRDNDGKISRSELEALLVQIGPKEEVTMMLSEVDREGDGCISVDALMSRVGAAGGAACELEELRETFDFFDTDHDEKITAEELLRVFTSIGDERCTLEDCKRMIAGVAKNDDGFVRFEDFTRMMELQR